MSDPGAKVPWASALLDLTAAMEAWISSSIKRNRHAAWLGGHDEGTFTSSWFAYYMLTGDRRVLDFLHFMRDGFLEFAKRSFHHGYYAEGEAHHQPEPFIFFLARLFHLDPSDQAVAAALEDAAEHVGNWVEGVPPWYDWTAHRFRSWKIGSKRVEAAHPWNHEVPDHMRFVQIAVLAFLATKRTRYLDFAQDHASKWAKLILEHDPIPGYLFADADLSSYPDELQRKVGMSEIENVELHVSAGTVDTLLDLYEIAALPLYADAAKKLLGRALPGLTDPYCQPVAAQLLKYREATGDTAFDAAVLDAVSSMDEAFEPESALLIVDDRQEPHPMGLGRRRDAVKWGYRVRDGGIVEERGPSPAALMLAYRITGRHRWLVSALRNAARRLRLACRVLPDGRQHGCAGATVGAVASGHGRACGIGSVTATLAPAAFGAYRFANGERLKVRYEQPDGSVGLPSGVAALFEPGVDGPPAVALCNASSSSALVRVVTDKRPDGFEVTVPAGHETRVEVDSG